MVTLYRLDLVSYYCPIVTLSVRHTISRYSHSKNTVTLKPGLGLLKVISEIFNVEKYCDLKILVKGQSRSLKMVPFDTLGMVSY